MREKHSPFPCVSGHIQLLMTIRANLLAVALALVVGAESPPTVAGGEAQVEPTTPWVLRAPLDALDDAVTIGLGDGVYVAYDVRTLGLVQCWSSGLRLATEPGARGPRAISRVDVLYSKGAKGTPWRAVKGSVRLPLAVEYKGCETSGSEASLLYELSTTEFTVVVKETPSILSEEETNALWSEWSMSPGLPAPFTRDEACIFQRGFAISGLPEDVDLVLLWDREVEAMTSHPGFKGRSELRRPDGRGYITHTPGVEPILLTLESPTAFIHKLVAFQ